MVLQSDVIIPTDGIKLQVANTRAFIANTDYGSGVLCVAESNLIWRLENGTGLCLEYPHIALHAISTDLNAFPHECLYVMLDQNILKENGDSEMPNEEEDDEDEEDNITEIRFVPPDKTMLNPLFVAMNDCQALYPDEYSSDEDENQEEEGEYNEEDEEEMNDGDNNEFGDGQDVHLSERGQQILNRINFNLPDTENETKNGNHSTNNDQFEDAD